MQVKSVVKAVGLVPGLGFSALPCAFAQIATAELVCTSCDLTSISADGTRATGTAHGNDETLRWKSKKVATCLGRSTDVLGVYGGQPAISADGKPIAATILSDDGKLATSGIGQGGNWTQLSPMPADGGSGGSQDRSVWNKPADGTAVVGLYWRYGLSGGSAHGFKWTSKTDRVGLSPEGGDSRMNGVNANGKVLEGWESDPNFGTWRAGVWVDGAKHFIGSEGNWSLAQAVSPNGKTIVGQDDNAKLGMTTAAIWTWTGSAWSQRMLGVLDGTDPWSGSSLANATSEDGKVVGGLNAKEWGPWGQVGFIWTPTGKFRSGTDFFAQHGDSNPDFNIALVMAINPDGKHFGIVERMPVAPFTQRSQVITLSGAAR